MKELSEELYLSRRDFVKALGLGATVLATGCLEPIENYFKQREREKRRIKPEELEKLNRVDVLYFDGSEKELYAYYPSTDYPYRYYNENGYEVFFDGDNIVYDPPVKPKEFSSKIVISGKWSPTWRDWTETDSKIFRSNVKHMLKVLREYSPEWYEKTMYAGEVIKPSGTPAASADGTISLMGEVVTKYVTEYIKQNDVIKLLQSNENFPHEVQHVIDDNTYFKSKLEEWKAGNETAYDKVDALESELRAGIAEVNDYRVKVGVMSEREAYDFIQEIFRERLPSALKVDTIKYKDRIDVLEQMYFNHTNKKVKIVFLNESWQQFKNL